MRLASRIGLVWWLVGALLPSAQLGTSAGPASVWSQDPETMLPEQSAAKAKELIQQGIQALGGQAYLNVRDIYCTGRFAQFSHVGEVTGYSRFFDYTKLPDKNRTEFSSKRNIITVYNGKEGWELDRGGVQEAPVTSLAQFEEGMKKDIDYLFRFRLKEEGMTFRYAGNELLDLKRVDWVEVVDRDRRTLRIAFDRTTHLPIRSIYIVRDPETRQRTEEVTYFSTYHPVQSVQTPYQILRERNGAKVFQVFFNQCQYNTNLADSFFTREALEQRWAQLNKGKKK